MGNKLYVGNISFQSDENSIEAAFGAFGEVKSVKIITDRDSGRSKGFGFVEMADDTGAQKAIESLDGKDLDGREIRVSEAKERTDSKPARSGGGGGGNRRY